MAKREPLAMAMATRVLFVCMGNICRSPMAHGVFRHMVRQAGLDSVVIAGSAGTHAFHQGEPADPRAQMAMSRRGYNIADLRARQVTMEDFESYDMILVMDWENLSLLQNQAPKRFHHKLQMLMRFASDHESATVPDPYQGGSQAFEQALSAIGRAKQTDIAHIGLGELPQVAAIACQVMAHDDGHVEA